MGLRPYLALIGIMFFAGASFFFALAESALFALGKWRAQQLAEHSSEAARKLARLLKDPQDLLATIVLGNTFANAGLVATALWVALRGEWPLGPTIAGVLLLVLIAGEVVPKTLAVRAPEFWSLRVVEPVLLVERSTRPLRKVAQKLNEFILRLVIPKSMQPQNALTDEEYQELVDMAYQQGALGHSEKEIILQIISLDRRTVSEVMRPRAQMAALPDDLPVPEMVAAARRIRHRRIPLYDETPDTIVGILNTRTLLLDPDHDLEMAVEFPSFVPESMNLLQLFRSFQRQQRGMAVVMDEFGGTAGLVTLEDILEEVIGEIRSEDETRRLIFEKLGSGRWRVSGAMRIDDFRREHPPLADLPGVETMGGLLVHELGVVPAQGESAVHHGLRLTALAVDERRVQELLIEDLRMKGAG